MAAKAIREYAGKKLLAQYFTDHPIPVPGTSGRNHLPNSRLLHVSPASFPALDNAPNDHLWLQAPDVKLVAKPDQLIKRRGQAGALALNKSWDEIKEWIREHMHKEVTVGALSGELDNFIVEPFIAHAPEDEYYVCLLSTREGTRILFHHEGGIDIGDVDSKAVKLDIVQGEAFTEEQARALISKVPTARQDIVSSFLVGLYKAYTDLHFTYLEINPLVVVGDTVHVLDMAARLDQTAEFLCTKQWGKDIEFPPPFGRRMCAEEKYIEEMDGKTGASLKLTVLNPQGRIWTMVAGGGASVIYSDTISDLGYAKELANYGEYSGAPSTGQTFEYAKTILDLMTREPHPEGKVLIVGGGIANFTNVAATFKGVVQAITKFQKILKEHKVRIFVRRGGPNWKEGLKIFRSVGKELGIPIEVFGPETHMTSIVPMALGLIPIPKTDKAQKKKQAASGEADYASSVLSQTDDEGPADDAGAYDREEADKVAAASKKPPSPTGDGSGSAAAPSPKDWYTLFTKESVCLVYGMQPRAVQGMLDFDHCCGRTRRSVAAMIYPFGGSHYQKFYWGTKELLIPVYATVEEAMSKHPDVDFVVNFASFRSVYESSQEILACDKVKAFAIIAEGVPEQQTKLISQEAAAKGVTLIGPATVGGIKPGCFRIGNTGGMLDNIISSKLYRPGSVAYVSKSGGMSNELNNILARTTDGVYEGVAIGGDRYPGTTFLDHILRYEANPDIKMIVLLGEVGGHEEYRICEALKDGRITKAVVAWCIGTCAGMLGPEIQFGHAGSRAGSDAETAEAKNLALAAAGCVVPKNFDELGVQIKLTYEQLIKDGVIAPRPEPPVPKIPVDYSWARELGLVRKPASFISTICDDRGQELLYAGMSITSVFEEDIGIGGVLSLLWFKRRLPAYACKFIEMILMVTADHGPAVSGAHNTMVTARAGKDLVSSLVSGLLTIGDRFGGALDGAATQFSEAYDTEMSPADFVVHMRNQRRLIMGIGHRIKSVHNPDMRVSIIKEYALKHFPSTPILNFAMEVEKITTAKRATLILNVDGCVAAAFVDLLRNCGAFTREEADEYVKIGSLNGLFVLGRSLGFIGHYLDQKRLKQGLYRHPWDDIAYMDTENQP
eukprot:TRINITY_DN5750_c0_g1_i1.p1 TRINITY_DN5750_c0_g1~~TRINITY_DN5750_c0_g1_i1.p1  ORF type:complete len:1122 (+),score=399.79 TRINITY_DN5750_c0_g1_i1:269-3634(+)